MDPKHLPPEAAPQIAPALIAWYDRHARRMPWRVPPARRRAGERPDPYHVWLSEVMLQQTQVKTVHAYFQRFVESWPTVADLARAETDAVMAAWAGLGYYSRARNLKRCAEIVAVEMAGAFPQTPDELRQLPGIGDYTANAIAAIAFDFPATVVDGNVERVVARLFRIEEPLPRAKPRLRAAAAELSPVERPGDYAQAMMDLGATICTPRRPACALCPIGEFCAGRAHGDPERFPVKAAKAAKPMRKGAAFIARRNDGAILLRRRPPKGLLGGMSEPPTSGWSARTDGETCIKAAPFEADWRKAGTVRHVFTHFELELDVWLAEIGGTPMAADVDEGWWSPPDRLPGEALPSVMKKAIAAAIPDAFG